MPENFEPKIENKPEIEKRPQVEFEVAPVETVRGLNELSVLRRIADSSWGEESDIDKEIDNLSKAEKDEVEKKFNALMVAGKSNDEAIERVALAKGKPEEVGEKTIEYLTRYKGFKKEEAKRFFKESADLLDDISRRYPKMVEILDEKTELDRQEKEEKSEQIKKYIDEAVDFFNPKKETTKTQRVHLLPNDPIKPAQGYGFDMGEDAYIISIPSSDSGRGLALEGLTLDGITVHEFLHGIINPITEKIELNKPEKKRIIDSVSFMLGNDRNYKGNAINLLNESLIRAYPLQFSAGRQISLENFKRQAGMMTEELYTEIMLKAERRGMAIKSKTLEEFKKSELEEFYSKYLKDKLGGRIADFYGDYAAQKEKDPNLSFEDYFTKNYKELLK